MSRIDDAVSRVLRMKYRLNLFKVPDTKYTDYPKFASKEFADVSRQAAVESMVLLKNDDNILPIKKDMKILVTGPNANSMRCLNGGWTYLWQGHMTDELPISKNYKTILAAMQDRFGKDNVVYEPGMTYGLTDQWVGNWGVEHVGDFDKVIAATKDIDIVVACIGETSYLSLIHISEPTRLLSISYAVISPPLNARFGLNVAAIFIFCGKSVAPIV